MTPEEQIVMVMVKANATFLDALVAAGETGITFEELHAKLPEYRVETFFVMLKQWRSTRTARFVGSRIFKTENTEPLARTLWNRIQSLDRMN